MISLHQPIYPLMRVVSPELNTYQLRELVEDYIREESQPTYEKGQVVAALQVTGNSSGHARKLASYINKAAKNHNFAVKSGYFADPDVDEHHWIQDGHLIVDVSIRKYRNYPQLENEILAELLDYSYVICDNPHDPIHRLYIEEIA